MARGLVRPWTDRFAVRTAGAGHESEPGPLRYGTPGGLRSLVEDLAAGLESRSGTRWRTSGPGPSVDGEPAAAVVLAMPDPQASDLLADELKEELAASTGREYEPAFALAAGWARRCWRELDGVFVADDPSLRGSPTTAGAAATAAPVLVAHTTSAFAAPHLDRPRDAAEPALAALRRLLEIDRPAGVDLPAALVAGPAGGPARGAVPPGRLDGGPVRRRLGLAPDRDGLDLRPAARPGAGGALMSEPARHEPGEQLRLRQHPEGGWFRETWRAPVEFTPSGYPGPRAAATSIVFLLRAGERSRWHRVRSDELWLWQGLGPLRLRLGGTGPAPEPGDRAGRRPGPRRRAPAAGAGAGRLPGRRPSR